MNMHSNLGPKIVVFMVGIFFLCTYCTSAQNIFDKLRQTYWSVSAYLEISEPDICSQTAALVKGLQTVSNDRKDFLYEPLQSFLLQIHGNLQRAMGKTMVLDAEENNTVVKLNNGHLSLISDPMNFTKEAQNFVAFQRWLEERHVPTLFVLAPTKICKYDSQLPYGVQDAQNDNADYVLKILRESHIEVIDLRDLYKNEPQKHYQNFYLTDTHWTPRYALAAFRILTENLSSKGIELPYHLSEIESYRVVYNTQDFDGILIRRVKGFVSHEKDFRLVPEFPVDVDRKEVSPGVVLFSHHDTNAALSDVRLLFISDSFGFDLATFFSYGFQNVEHICQNRNDVDVRKQVEDFKPDMVIFLVNTGFYVNHFNLGACSP